METIYLDMPACISQSFKIHSVSPSKHYNSAQLQPCIWFMSHLARSSAPQGISSGASSALPGRWAIAILSLTRWCRRCQQGCCKSSAVWGFLGPHEYLDLKTSVRWNEQWQFIIVIKGKGSQKKLRSLEALWRVMWHECGPMKAAS